MRADGVERAGLEPGSVAMPDVRRLLDEWDAPDLPLGLVLADELFDQCQIFVHFKNNSGRPRVDRALFR